MPWSLASHMRRSIFSGSITSMWYGPTCWTRRSSTERVGHADGHLPARRGDRRVHVDHAEVGVHAETGHEEDLAGAVLRVPVRAVVGVAVARLHVAQDRTGEVFLVTGLRCGPNLGVTDTYTTIATPGQQVAVRMSDTLGDDRRVGGRAVQDRGDRAAEEAAPHVRGKEQGSTFDLTWDAYVPRARGASAPDPLREHDHPRRGPLRAGGRLGGVDEGRRPGVGGVARHLGRRPRPLVGHPARGGAARPRPARRDARWPQLLVALHADPLRRLFPLRHRPGRRRRQPGINEAVRMWPDGRIEQLGWPEVEIAYRSGTRHPERAVMHLRDENHKPFDVEFETLGYVAIGLGAGYGGDEWSHGRWMGRGWVDQVSYDLTDPEVLGRISFGMLDHVAKATCNGAVGYGLFEHTNVGRHVPSGFADYGSRPTRPEPCCRERRSSSPARRGRSRSRSPKYLARTTTCGGSPASATPRPRQVEAVGVTTLVVRPRRRRLLRVARRLHVRAAPRRVHGAGLDYDHAMRVNAEGTGLLLRTAATPRPRWSCRRTRCTGRQRGPDARVPRDRPARRGERGALADVLDVEDRAGGRGPLLRALPSTCPVIIARMNASYGRNGGLPAHAPRRDRWPATRSRRAGTRARTARSTRTTSTPRPRALLDAASVPATVVNWAGDERRERAGVGGLHGRADRHRPVVNVVEPPGTLRGSIAERRQARLVHRAVHGDVEGRHPRVWEGTARRRRPRRDDGARHRLRRRGSARPPRRRSPAPAPPSACARREDRLADGAGPLPRARARVADVGGRPLGARRRSTTSPRRDVDRGSAAWTCW